jgi:hypothetical protein
VREIAVVSALLFRRGGVDERLTCTGSRAGASEC